MVVFTLSMLIYSFAWLRTHQPQRPIIFLLVISGMISFIFPIVAGFMQELFQLRYITMSLVIFLMLIPVLFFNRKQNVTGRFSRYLFSAYSVFVMIVFIALHSPTRLSYVVDYKNEYVRVIDENSDRLKSGIAGYWETKDVKLMSSGKNRVVPVYDYFDAYIWQVSRVWFVGKKGGEKPVFNFTIDMRPDAILGPPLDTLPAGNHTIFVYPDFVFENIDGWKMPIHKKDMLPTSK